MKSPELFLLDHYTILRHQGAIATDRPRKRLRWRERDPFGNSVYRSLTLSGDAEAAYIASELVAMRAYWKARCDEGKEERRLRREGEAWLRKALEKAPGRILRKRLFEQWKPRVMDTGFRDIVTILEPWDVPPLKRGRPKFRKTAKQDRTPDIFGPIPGTGKSEERYDGLQPGCDCASGERDGSGLEMAEVSREPDQVRHP